MISRVIFRPAAETDLQEAFDWYEKRQTSLGVEFISQVDSCIGKIISQPEMYPVVHSGVRQAPIRRFPYCVMYLHAQDNIVVLAVFAGRARPEDLARPSVTISGSARTRRLSFRRSLLFEAACGDGGKCHRVSISDGSANCPAGR
jgi:toxin ParE1/3/4